MKFVLKLGVVVFLILVALSIGNPALGAGTPVAASSPAAIIYWNEIAVRTVIDIGGRSNGESEVFMALPQAAVYDAVVAIEGGYQPYKLKLTSRPGASLDAAVAAAAHDTLVHYFPDQKAVLNYDYSNALTAIPDGAAKQAGIALGQAAAAGIIADRMGDGLDANIGFVMPPPAPGVWQLTNGFAPNTPWLSKYRPFMLTSVDQFRPAPPPALDSSEWATEFNEVKAVGSSNSTLRTAEQTDIVYFWSRNPVTQYNPLFKKIVASQHLNAVQTARLYAMSNLVGADALIACWDAKYHYLFWRPQTAIPQASTSENPDTVGDAKWEPLGQAPPHPEYPSAHGCYTGAQTEMLTEFLGTDQINVDISSSAPNLIQSTRHYATVSDIVSQVANARVWGGIHYRGSTTTGELVGENVAKWTLARNFLPAPINATLPATGSAENSAELLWLGMSGIIVMLCGIWLVRTRNVQV